MPKVKLMQGNQACCEAALAAGVNFFAGYPITPSTEFVEFMAERLPQTGGRFIQMEDEIASMGAVCGASLAGMKALTATSGPGFSLKQEFIGYAAMTELPLTIVNVQRVGPSTGNIFAAQGDVMQARWGSNGDRAVIALSPSSVRETFDVTIKAINLSERFRTPVIILLDEIIAHMREEIVLPDPSEIEIIDRIPPTGSPESYEPFRPNERGIPPMGAFGGKYPFHVTGLIHDFKGMPSNDPDVATELVERLHTKIERAKDEITFYHTLYTE
ncbi:MAG: 2-oxoacid:acceptor oxidoreductase subunit alpha, partial [Betaproteobacteria bacterium]